MEKRSVFFPSVIGYENLIIISFIGNRLDFLETIVFLFIYSFIMSTMIL